MRAIFGVLALAAIAGMLVWGLGAGLQTGGEQFQVENETWTPDVGNETVLEESNRDGAYYSDAVVVRDENGTLSEAGEDYAWDDSDGTIQALAGGNLEGDANATVTYGFVQPSESQLEWAALLSQLPNAIGILLPVGAFLLLVGVARGLM